MQFLAQYWFKKPLSFLSGVSEGSIKSLVENTCHFSTVKTLDGTFTYIHFFVNVTVAVLEHCYNDNNVNLRLLYGIWIIFQGEICLVLWIFFKLLSITTLHDCFNKQISISDFTLTHYSLVLYSIPPENIRKLLGFLMSSGGIHQAAMG